MACSYSGIALEDSSAIRMGRNLVAVPTQLDAGVYRYDQGMVMPTPCPGCGKLGLTVTCELDGGGHGHTNVVSRALDVHAE